MSLDNELELTIEACKILDADNQQLKQRNAELMAQIERLRKCGNLCAVNLSYSADAFASEYKALWKKAASATPTQCLAEHDREVAVRAVKEFRAALVESVSLPFKAHIDGACDVAQHQISLAAKAGEV